MNKRETKIQENKSRIVKHQMGFALKCLKATNTDKPVELDRIGVIPGGEELDGLGNSEGKESRNERVIGKNG